MKCGRACRRTGRVKPEKARFYVINAAKIARECSFVGRINTVMQMAFFHLTQILPGDSALAELQGALPKVTVAKAGDLVDAFGRLWRWHVNP